MPTPNKKDKKQPLVRIDAADKRVLDQLSAETGESAPKLLHKAIKRLEKEVFFGQINQAYKDMRENNELWQIELEDRALFDQSASDGLRSEDNE